MLPSDRHNRLKGTTYSRSSDTRDMQNQEEDECTDDGELSSGTTSSYETESIQQSAARDILSQEKPVSSISANKTQSDAPSTMMPPEMR